MNIILGIIVAILCIINLILFACGIESKRPMVVNIYLLLQMVADLIFAINLFKV